MTYQYKFFYEVAKEIKRLSKYSGDKARLNCTIEIIDKVIRRLNNKPEV